MTCSGWCEIRFPSSVPLPSFVILRSLGQEVSVATGCHKSVVVLTPKDVHFLLHTPFYMPFYTFTVFVAELSISTARGASYVPHHPIHYSAPTLASMSRIEVDVSSERTAYSNNTFTEKQLVSRTNPLLQFHTWFKEAQECPQIPEANAVCLSTCSKSGKPSSRMVLVKTFTDAGFTFFTNYESRKGRELEENPNAAMLFYWPQLHYQVRIEGTVTRLSDKDSTDYFNSRPKSSQASAVVSRQSRVISSREELEATHRALLEEYNGDDHVITKPAYWGGYILSPTVFEFWHGKSNRLHDRIVFTKVSGTETWTIKRLSP